MINTITQHADHDHDRARPTAEWLEDQDVVDQVDQQHQHDADDCAICVILFAGLSPRRTAMAAPTGGGGPPRKPLPRKKIPANLRSLARGHTELWRPGARRDRVSQAARTTAPARARPPCILLDRGWGKPRADAHRRGRRGQDQGGHPPHRRGSRCAACHRCCTDRGGQREMTMPQRFLASNLRTRRELLR